MLFSRLLAGDEGIEPPPKVLETKVSVFTNPYFVLLFQYCNIFGVTLAQVAI